jgi:uncharacterized protein YeeX (DUF496 family)
LGKSIALIVRSNIKGIFSIMAADYKSTFDDGVVWNTKDGGSAKDELARSFKTSEEPA